MRLIQLPSHPRRHPRGISSLLIQLIMGILGEGDKDGRAALVRRHHRAHRVERRQLLLPCRDLSGLLLAAGDARLLHLLHLSLEGGHGALARFELLAHRAQLARKLLLERRAKQIRRLHLRELHTPLVILCVTLGLGSGLLGCRLLRSGQLGLRVTRRSLLRLLLRRLLRALLFLHIAFPLLLIILRLLHGGLALLVSLCALLGLGGEVGAALFGSHSGRRFRCGGFRLALEHSYR